MLRQGGIQERVLDRLLVVHLVRRDELLADLLDLDHVAELDVLARLAALEELRVRLEEAEELLVVGDGLAVQDATPRLIHDALPSAMEVGELFHQRLGLGVGPDVVALRLDASYEPVGHGSRPAADPLHTPNQPLIRAFERSGPSALLRGRRAIVRASRLARRGCSRPDPTPPRPPRGLARSSEPAPGRCPRAGTSRWASGCSSPRPWCRDAAGRPRSSLAHGMVGERVIDLLPGRRTQCVLELVERREVHHGLRSQANELAQGRAVIDADDGLPQRQPLQGLHDEQAEHVLRGESDPRGPRPVGRR